jgi:hypothetical protein
MGAKLIVDGILCLASKTGWLYLSPSILSSIKSLELIGTHHSCIRCKTNTSEIIIHCNNLPDYIHRLLLGLQNDLFTKSHSNIYDYSIFRPLCHCCRISNDSKYIIPAGPDFERDHGRAKVRRICRYNIDSSTFMMVQPNTRHVMIHIS